MPILHRLLILSCLALWCAFPTEGKSKPAKRKGPPMKQRILFHPAPTVEWLKGLQVETLGKIPKGTWLAADDAVALELLKRDKSTLMIYPTREDYQEMMEGLSEAEIAEVMSRKHAVVSSDPKAFTLPAFSERSMHLLSASASGSNEPGAFGQAMRTLFEREIQFLRVLMGGDDNGGIGAVSLFSNAFEPLNELNWEEEVLRKHVGAGLPPLDPSLEKSRSDLALHLQRGERKHGAKYDHEPTGRVWARLERGVYAVPLDTLLVEGIRSSHEPVVEWKDGFVCLWQESAFDQYPMKEKKKQILYFNGKRFQAEHMGLTRSQLRLRIAKRAKMPREDDAREYLADLKLDAVLDLGCKLKAAERFDKPLSEMMSRHLGLETESLRKLLAAYPIWRKARKYTQEEINAGSSLALKELEFWNAWAAANHWPLQQEQLEGYLAAIRKQ